MNNVYAVDRLSQHGPTKGPNYAIDLGPLQIMELDGNISYSSLGKGKHGF